MNEYFEILKEVITSRRTVKTAQMNGSKVSGEHIDAILQLADWAPTHGRTEPWRFVVYGEAQVAEFCAKHAELYKTNAANFVEATYNNLKNMGNNASHIIIPIMRRGNLPQIPELEEIASASCAIQNVLLGAQALGIAAFWSTGGQTLKPAMKTFLQLRDEDIVMGLIYLGYSDAPAVAGTRSTPFEEKVSWNVGLLPMV